MISKMQDALDTQLSRYFCMCAETVICSFICERATILSLCNEFFTHRKLNPDLRFDHNKPMINLSNSTIKHEFQINHKHASNCNIYILKKLFEKWPQHFRGFK